MKVKTTQSQSTDEFKEQAAQTLDGFVDFLCRVGQQHDGQRVDMEILDSSCKRTDSGTALDRSAG